MTKRLTILGFVLAGCVPCEGDNPFTEQTCDGHACYGYVAGGDDVGADAEELVCTSLVKAYYVDKAMYCGNYEVPDFEHCTTDAANAYDLTDYFFYDSWTGVVKQDFVTIFDVDDPGEPDADFWTWSHNWKTALPGVLTHDDGKWAAFASRGCCPQSIVAGDGEWIPHNPDCQEGQALNNTPLGWCLPFSSDAENEDHRSGMCVYPCGQGTLFNWEEIQAMDQLQRDIIVASASEDCPNPSQEFCDFSRPDPMGQAPGVCRYKSTPTIPTATTAIGDKP